MSTLSLCMIHVIAFHFFPKYICIFCFFKSLPSYSATFCKYFGLNCKNIKWIRFLFVKKDVYLLRYKRNNKK